MHQRFSGRTEFTKKSQTTYKNRISHTISIFKKKIDFTNTLLNLNTLKILILGNKILPLSKLIFILGLKFLVLIAAKILNSKYNH